MGVESLHSWDNDVARSIIDENKELAGALMPILTSFIDKLGYINLTIVPEIAEALNISRAEVYGVITFYSDFHTTPPGLSVIKICH